MKRRLSIFSAAAELAPFAKSGGLGDVAIALPKHLLKLGHDVRTVLPYYSFIRHRHDSGITRVAKDTIHLGYKTFPVEYFTTTFEGLPVYFVWNEQFFGHSRMYNYPDDNLRFYFFDLAVIRLIELLDVRPDVIHCHDWQTGLIPNLIRVDHGQDERFHHAATVFTIHNLPFQMGGHWWGVPEDQRDEGKGLPSTSLRAIPRLNPTKRGIRYADAINTVSERYAQEILTPEFGQGLDGLLRRRRDDVHGIINGIDYAVFNPTYDPSVWQRYDVNSLDGKRRNKRKLQQLVGLEVKPDTPLIGMVHRLTEQKGFNLVLEVMPTLLKLPLQLVVAGPGDKDYSAFFRKVAKAHPERVGYSADFDLASKVYAGSDMFLMPSRYEPCGISQLISLRYGSVPIVHQTGGLSDTVSNFNPRTMKGNGFAFPAYTREDLLVALVRALETYRYPHVWRSLMRNAMRESYSWALPTRKYVQLYRRVIAKRQRL